MKKELEKFLANYRNKKIHVIAPSGTEGSGSLIFFDKLGFENIFLHDFSEEKEFKKNFHSTHISYSAKERVEIFEKIKKYPVNFRENYLKGIEEANLIVIPQSFFLHSENTFKCDSNKKFLFIKEKKIPFITISEMYLKFSYKPTIGVTGTNGKTTTFRLIKKILESFGKKVLSGSNDRGSPQNLDKITEPEKYDFLLLELSHRQLQFLDISPKISGITYLGKDHLDECKDIEEYHSWKKNIFKFQKKSDKLWLNFDDKKSLKLLEKENIKSNVFFFSIKNNVEKGVFAKGNLVFFKNKNFEKEIFNLENFNLLGDFNKSNLLLSIGISISALGIKNIKKDVLEKSIFSFKPPENRLQILLKLENKTFFNNIASRTPDSTEKALECIGRSLVIVGGETKNLELDSLAKKIKETESKLIFLPGSGSIELEKKLSSKEIFSSEKNLENALKKSLKSEFKNILISPTFTGFTRFLEGKTLEEIVKKAFK